jgi:heme exporter protein D
MMPDLGKYTFAVLSSYGYSLALIIGLVVFVVLRNIKARKVLEAIEAEVNHGKD